MNKDFPPSLAEIYEEFEDLEDWEERYEFILDLGRELPPLSVDLQTEQNKVHGCMSTVWMVVDPVESNGAAQPQIEIRADSDSMIVKGLIVILLSIFDHKTSAEAVTQDAQQVFARLGLNQHLSPNRRNGLFSMVKRVRELALQIEATQNNPQS